jgi:hypothetical protein
MLMRSRRKFTAGLCLLACAAGGVARAASTCEHYGTDIAVMADVDKALRNRWDFAELSAARTPAQVPKIVQQTEIIDRTNTRRLKSLVAACGWPGARVHGGKTAHEFWLLVQHADHDRAFQRRYLAWLTDAVARGDGSANDLAYLTDRVELSEGKPQRYGTQFEFKTECELVLKPLDDPEAVDRRRKAAGMPPLASYIAQAEQFLLPTQCRSGAD